MREFLRNRYIKEVGRPDGCYRGQNGGPFLAPSAIAQASGAIGRWDYVKPIHRTSGRSWTAKRQDADVIFYEYGSGISMSGDKGWEKLLHKDWDAADALMKDGMRKKDMLCAEIDMAMGLSGNRLLRFFRVLRKKGTWNKGSMRSSTEGR